ncbi:C-Maf-inducing protein-like isoform X2 [Arctopsyche grandis]|uniref:C-Maf-inducing protein-like isoform X2 n=1 Tax=Arctopsyche grandis TaxID=121162 RepID=UPI00406D89F9
MFCFGRRAERQPGAGVVAVAPPGEPPPPKVVKEDSSVSSDGKFDLATVTPREFPLARLKYIDSDRNDDEDTDDNVDDGNNSDADPGEVFLVGVPPPLPKGRLGVVDSLSSEEDPISPRTLDGGASSASTADIGRLLSTTSSHHTASLESTNSNTDLTNLVPDGSPTQGRSPAPGPRFKLLVEGDIHVCRLNHTRTVISKMLSSKFLRRWENHHLYLNDHCISSKTPSGFMETPIMYSSMEDIYTVLRWDSNYKYCLRIVLPDGSFLLQAKNAYTRDHWFHSIVWRRNMYKYRSILHKTDTTVLLKELKNMVDFVMVTPLQDERVTHDPLEIVTNLLSLQWPDDGEMILMVVGPVVGAAPLPAPLAKALSRMCSTRPLSPRLNDTLHHVARYILKHNVDFGKAPHLRHFLQDYISALNQSSGGAEAVRAWVGAVHGPGFNCPHPRVLPNLAAACLAAFHSIYSPTEKESEELKHTIPVNIDYEFDCQDDLPDDTPADDPSISPDMHNNNVELDDISPKLPPKKLHEPHYCDVVKNKDVPASADDVYIVCFANVILFMSSYADWAESLGAVLQPVPIPHRILQSKAAASALASAAFKLGTDRRCAVHRFVLPLRQGRSGWLQILCPTHSNPDPDRLQQWGEILDTLLNCCCKRKCFLVELAKMLPACLLLALRAHSAGLVSLCLMLEWEVLEDEQSRVEAVQALRSTPPGKRALQASCQRQVHLKKLQQKGGPRRLTLPSCATDADVSRLLSAGSFGNLECLSLAFTHVTSAVAEELIKLPSLRYLNLWATQFGDAGVLLIVEHLHRLQVLNLCETPVSDIGISALSALPSLKKLNLNSTKLTAATWARLQPKLPALQESDIRYTDAW